MGMCERIRGFEGRESLLAVKHGPYYLIPIDGSDGYLYPRTDDPIVAVYRESDGKKRAVLGYHEGNRHRRNFNYLFDLSGDELDAAVMAIALGGYDETK